MTDLFIRKVSLQIIPKNGQVKKLEGLRTKFSLKKTDKSSLNAGEITVFNLNQESRNLIGQKKTKVVLTAGYESNAGVIFVGDITKAEHEREDTEIVTTMEVRDGDNPFRNAIYNKSFPPNTTSQYIFNDLINSMGLIRGSINGIPSTQYKRGFCYSGMARDLMDELCSKNDLAWSIQNGAVQITPKNGFTLESIVSLSKTSGLIEEPSKTKTGVKFKSLLQPELTPRRRVNLDADKIKGVYKILTVTIDGDSHEGPFYAECEAKANG